MCGLVVVLGLAGRQADAAILTRMAQSIAHRGPDDSGLYLDHEGGFGFRRLSILDLSPAGHQPMCSEDGQLVVVFNGEIYNYIELRDELRAAGFCFRSTSDTEVLLAAYRHWGAECLAKLNGMWAFVIHDRRHGVLFGARDRFGVKPLFVHRGKDCWLLASEIKAILASGLYARDTNWQVAADFLIDGKLDETAATFYAGIEQLPPGSAFELRLDGSWRQWTYWSLPGLEPEPITDVEETFAELLEDAVRIRLRSDVPVGACLSGGLDSTAGIWARGPMRHWPAIRATSTITGTRCSAPRKSLEHGTRCKSTPPGTGPVPGDCSCAPSPACSIITCGVSSRIAAWCAGGMVAAASRAGLHRRSSNVGV